MSIRAVVVTYNSAKVISQCIKSLVTNNVTDIVVVDNASTDDIHQQTELRDVRTVCLTTNVGFAAACNVGARACEHEALLFLNPDAELTSGAVARAMHTLRKNSSIGAVGLLLQSASAVPELTSFGDEVTLREVLQRRIEKKEVPAAAKEVGWVSAGALLVRTKAFQEIGGFDDGFFMYWEDVDLAYRLRQAGWRIFLEPQARVIHLRGASESDRGRKTQWYDHSADRYFRKHYATSIWLTQRLWRKTYRLFSSQVH